MDTSLSDREQSVEQVRGLLNQAASVLRSLSPEHARLAWLVEDTVAYLDELDEPMANLEDLDLGNCDVRSPKAANGGAI